MKDLSRGMTPKLISSLSLAGLAGGLGTIAFSFVYAFTHGSTTVNKMGSLLGMNEMEWGRIAAIIPILLWAALFVFRLRIVNRISRLFDIGYWMTSIALALRILSEIPQFFIDMRMEYLSPLGTGSWLLYLLSLPLLTIGMLLMAVGCRRSGMSRSAFYATLFVGLSLIPTVLAGGILAEFSDDSTIYRISVGLLSIPQGLAWSWLALLSPYVPNKSTEFVYCLEEAK